MAVGRDQVTIVIPTLNEEEAIGPVIDELKEEGFENILVVDGYSTDSTVDIVKSKGVKVVPQLGVGKSGAIKTAIDLVETPYMVVMDGDDTYDPKDVEKLLYYAEKYDLIIGFRRNRKNIPKLHRIGNKIINFVFNFFMGQSLSDVCSGMYLLKTKMARNLEFKSRGFDVEVEIAAQCCSNGKVTEVPINYRKRIGKKKLKTWQAGLRILWAILYLARAYNPTFILAFIASFLTIPGVVILVWELTLRYLYGAQAWSEGRAWLGLFLLIVGLHGFTLATVSLILRRIEAKIASISSR
jgi:dolichol-phosphate mannosyltransferase